MQMSFFYDINKKLQQVLESPKSEHKQLNEGAAAVAEAGTGDYSAKKAAAGKDIGKPGKQFAKIAKSAGERYGSEERGRKVAGAMLAKLRAKKGMGEGQLPSPPDEVIFPKGGKHAPVDVYKKPKNEGNKFTGNLAKARAAGKKQADLDGDGDMEKVQHEAVEKTARGVVHKAGAGGYGRKFDTDEEGDEKDNAKAEVKRGRGRPKKGSDDTGAVKKYDDTDLAKAMGVGKAPKTFKGATTKHKIAAEGADDPADQGEYDQEGDMAKDQLHTLTKAAEELSSILDDDQDLPEWVQSKITKALEFINTSNDYMDQERHDSDDMNKLDEEPKSKNQAIAARIARGVQKGEVKAKPGSASAEMAKMKPKELNKFAKGSTKGLPKKVSKKKEEVEETTTAGAVATAPTSGKASKGGMQFGKGIYDSWNRELEQVIAESMNISMNMNSDSHGGPGRSLTVTATEEDAMKLAALLKMAGVGGEESSGGCGCGETPCGCDRGEIVDENKPDWPTNTETSSDALQYAGGLNKPKTDVAGDGQTTVPVTAVHTQDEDELRRMMEMAGLREASTNPYPVGQDAVTPQERLNPTNNPNKSVVQGIKDFIKNPTKPAMEEELEEAKPDYIDLDKDGDKEESMKQAAYDAKQSVKEDLQADDGEFYPSSDDFFGQFEADHFDKEVESDDGMEVRGYIDGENVMVWRFNDESKTDGYGVYNDDALRDTFSESLAEMKRLWQPY
jgi:hypothetical protein